MIEEALVARPTHLAVLIAGETPALPVRPTHHAVLMTGETPALPVNKMLVLDPVS